jgi:DNA-directed RNA polymerase specialized sigma24 family protein
MPSTLQDKKRLYSAISRLPEGYIEPMVLRYVKGQPSSLIAKAMGIIVSSDNSRLVRAANRLHGLLRDNSNQNICR